MKNNGVKNEHKINTCRRTDQLWLFPSLHFMIFVMPAMFGSIFLMSGYIAVMFLEQIGTALICTALMFRHLSWVDDQTSLYRETLAFGKKSSFPGQQVFLIGTERVGNPAFAVVLPPQLCCRRRKRLRWKL